MFRFICIVIFLILFLILTIPILIVEWIIGKFAPNARDISSLRIVQWGFKVILKITGVKTTVIGEENIPDEAVLFVGFDPLADGCISPISIDLCPSGHAGTYLMFDHITRYLFPEFFHILRPLRSWSHKAHITF